MNKHLVVFLVVLGAWIALTWANSIADDSIALPSIPEDIISAPVPNPTPVPTSVKECFIYSISVEEVGLGYHVISGAGSTLPCLKNIFKRPGCKVVPNVTFTKYQNLCDDMVANHFRHSYSSGFMDDECNQVPAPNDPADLCGDLKVRYALTPLSLIWDQRADIDDIRAVNSFPLELNEEGKWYHWRASSATPLLVYDPNYSGEVTSASQLFGNWSFGGKAVSSLQKTVLDGYTSEPSVWNDGYEALASLDTNHDNQLMGNELRELSLWFDDNENGVSESGEVKPLTELGVIALSIKPDIQRTKHGFLQAKLGYRRVVRGVTITGATVDWTSPKFATRLDAQIFIDILDSMGNDGRSTGEKEDREHKAEDEISTVNKQLGYNVSGAWLWVVDEEVYPESGEYLPKGVFTFSDKGEAINGHSLTEIPLRKRIGEATRFVMLAPLEGKKSIDSSGNTTFKMSITHKDGTLTRSKVRLEKDGYLMVGESELMVPGAKQEGGIASRYTWKARPLVD